jgi:A/G-specific adenine glycosylase
MSVDMSCISEKLLSWYDAHARALPWRNPPGAPPADPYRVWLSEIMLQQTTVVTVRAYFVRFTTRWPTVDALALAQEGDVMAAWAGLGYYSRARNLVACARVLAADGFPADEAGLQSLPGVGPYTAAAIAAIAFGQRAVVVDGNVERVVARLFGVETPLPAAKPELKRLAGTITPDMRCGDFAQAMMDLGATVCVPRNPKCGVCPLSVACAALAGGDPASYPRRALKTAKPERTATAWWIESDGQVLLMRRPAKGLLGGMMALPSTLVAPAEAAVALGITGAFSRQAPASAGATFGTVTHVFTHFRLTMAVNEGVLDPGCVLPPDAQWWPVTKLADAGLPTLFAKAATVAMRERR